VVSVVPWVRTPWVVGHTEGADAFKPMLLLLISYEQKTQTLKMYDLVGASSTAEYSRRLMFGFC